MLWSVALVSLLYASMRRGPCLFVQRMGSRESFQTFKLSGNLAKSAGRTSSAPNHGYRNRAESPGPSHLDPHLMSVHSAHSAIGPLTIVERITSSEQVDSLSAFVSTN